MHTQEPVAFYDNLGVSRGVYIYATRVLILASVEGVVEDFQLAPGAAVRIRGGLDPGKQMLEKALRNRDFPTTDSDPDCPGIVCTGTTLLNDTVVYDTGVGTEGICTTLEVQCSPCRWSTT